MTTREAPDDGRRPGPRDAPPGRSGPNGAYSDRTRRRLLFALSAVLAGCVGEPATPPPVPTPERRPTSTTTRSASPTSTETPTPTQTPTDTPTRTATPGLEARTHLVGTTFTVGTLRPVSYRVTAVELTSSLGTGYGSFRPDGVFLLVGFTVRNVGENPVVVERTDFTLVDDRRVVPVDVEATGRLPASRGVPHRVVRELHPGQDVSGWLVFDVPEDTRDWRLRIQPPDRTAPPHDVVLASASTPTASPTSPT